MDTHTQTERKKTTANKRQEKRKTGSTALVNLTSLDSHSQTSKAGFLRASMVCCESMYCRQTELPVNPLLLTPGWGHNYIPDTHLRYL